MLNLLKTYKNERLRLQNERDGKRKERRKIPDIFKNPENYTEEEFIAFCCQEAKQFKTRTQWHRDGRMTYDRIVNKYGADSDEMSLCCAHMSPVNRKHVWSLERCIKIASKYETVKEWRTSSMKSYNAAQRAGWFEQCAGHMSGRRLRKKA